MQTQLRSFVHTYCVQHPSARMPLAQFIKEYKHSLPAKYRDAWTRGRIVAEIAEAGFQIGVDQKVYFIGGLALRGNWIAVDGRMELARVR